MTLYATENHLEKLISNLNRFYLDHNATTPLSSSVIDWLGKGVFHYGNPASHHTSGKKAHHMVEEGRDYLLETFKLRKTHHLFFHSGSTEGLNTFFFGLVDYYKASGKKTVVVYLRTDHSILWEIGKRVSQKKGAVKIIETDEKGNFDFVQFEEMLKNNQETTFLFNYCWVNNETGIVFPLSDIEKLREKYSNLIVHVDATQAIGRVPGFSELSSVLDVYTFSGHKFGAMKGIGFTFWKKSLPFTSYIVGGGQQLAMRSGTENSMGVHSIRLALEDTIKNFNPDKTLGLKEELEKQIEGAIQNRGELIGKEANFRNLNTSLFYFSHAKSDILLASFDLEGIEVGRGSACSTGQSKGSPILTGLLKGESKTKNVIRFSLPLIIDNHYENAFKDKGIKKILNVLKKI